MTKTKCGTLALVLVVLGSISFDAYAFRTISKNGHEARWKRTPVKYYVYEEGPKSFKPAGYDMVGESVSLQDVIDASFQSWAEIPDVDLNYEFGGTTSDPTGGNDGRNEMIFVSYGWTDLAFEPPATALAVTISTYIKSSGEIIDSDIYFNDDYFSWGYIDTAYEQSSGYVVDIQNIATHEIGHLFGVDHSSENPGEVISDYRYATMFYSSSPGETFRRFLSTDDILAAKHLYPTEAYGEAIAEPEITSVSPSEGYNDQRSNLITIKGSNFGPLSMVKLTGENIREDEVCKITSYTEDTIECSLDLYYVSGGTYNVVVANSYQKEAALTQAYTVYGPEYSENKMSGGCGSINESSKTNVSLFGMIILIFPIMIPIFRKRSWVMDEAGHSYTD